MGFLLVCVRFSRGNLVSRVLGCIRVFKLGLCYLVFMVTRLYA